MKGKWTTFFISDPHFGHSNVIEFCNRPFKSKEQMKDEIIANINKLVKKEDLLIWVGDCFFYHSVDEMRETMQKINCKRNILVRGNHDLKPRQMMNAGFDLCVERMTMRIAGENVLISHYPFRMDDKLMRWLKIKKPIHKMLGLRPIYFEKHHKKRPIDNGCFLIHGHTHSEEQVKGKMIHVGVDAWDFRPVNIQQISNLIGNIKNGKIK